MKRLIASDLHGSARFCRQLLERYQQEGAQQLILLGDLVYSGSYAPQYEYVFLYKKQFTSSCSAPWPGRFCG